MNKLTITLGITVCTLMIGACSADDAKEKNEKTENKVVTLNVSAAQATNITLTSSSAVSTTDKAPKKDLNNKMAPPNVIPKQKNIFK